MALVGILALLLMGGAALPAATLAPQLLRCEYLRDPAGIDVLQPRLSWELAGEGRGQRQTAWQILVASSPDLLEDARADLWNSGKVAGDQTVHLRYAGQPLGSAQHAFWRVRAWDAEDRPSPWSPIARWSMGLLRDDDWGGAWIGLEGRLEPAHLRGASWIVFPPDHATAPAARVERYYRRVVRLPEGREVNRIRFLYTGDSSVNGWINGRELGSRNDHRRIKEQDLTFRLQPGDNVLALTGTAPGGAAPSGGVVGLLEVIFATGEPLRIPTDASWKASAHAPAGWHEPGFDDSAWTAARDLGAVGREPWGEVRIAEDRRLPARYLRREFDVAKPIRRATLFASGLGWSEYFLNGERVGDHVLSPALSEYPKRTFYVTHDVTAQVRPGRNALGAALGNGRFFGPRSIVYASMPTFGFPKLRLQLRLEFDDGSLATVVSDDAWKLTTEGPVVANNDFDGEEYDARRELGPWTRPGYDDSRWARAHVVPAPPGRLAAQMIDPIRVTDTLKPVARTEPSPGVFVFDLGQNIVGWVRLRVAGTRGTVVTLRHAETLRPDGTPALANLRSAQATNRYTLQGGGAETWEPAFSTQGFRYVEVRGYPGTPALDAIEGRVVNDDLRVTGTFESSNPLLDRILRHIAWGVRGNNKSVPFDCPQRDERQGWLGDRSEVARGESYLFDNAAFYAKWLQDIRDTQKENGSLPDIAPNHWPSYTDNVTWPSTALIAPAALLDLFADTEAVAQAYEPAKRWMQLMAGFVRDGIIARDQWTDWCVPPEDRGLIHTKDPSRITGAPVLATTFLHHDARLMARFARQLGRTEDEAHFTALAEQLKTAFHRQFYRPEHGHYDNGTQTSSVLPLAFGMVPEAERPRVFAGLVRNITDVSRGHVGTGVVGIKHLFRVLSDHGRADLAYTLATQRDYPSYGYMIAKGATTLWELWNGDTADPWMNSGNHVMLAGDLVIWCYEYLAGIRPDPTQPGFKHVLLRPHPVGDLRFVRARYHSIRGPITSAWQRTDEGGLAWRVTLPPNTTATVHLPAVAEARITESGRPIAEAPEVTLVRREADQAILAIGSGTYDFAVGPPPPRPPGQ